ncbi:Werner Syndrome-like exonuclease isoform X1 [Nematostella vectensis]|uniref:Werner Syndrome-like exonuclease isoform X1 n=1 Tax=Nematostella vectensis TaxID=45351 RepID=UPI002076FE27|nr:Werner Syndrome-like exonuclease isoform X1 [Nematostella vectensis]
MSDIMENGKRKKRTLPSWMTKKDRCDDSKKPDNNDEEEVRTKAKQARVLPACFFEGFSDSKLPLLQYRGMISYSTHKDECNFICDQLISSDNKPVMGFDMEWRVAFASGGGSRKTSLIQLCSSESTCYLFQLSSMAGY